MSNLEQFLEKAEQCETDIQAGKVLKSFEDLIEQFDWMTEQKTALMNQDKLYFKYVLITKSKTRAEFTLVGRELTVDYIKQDGTKSTVRLEQSNVAAFDAIFN